MVLLKEGITHTLAVLVILTYIFLLIMGAFKPIEIPQTFSTIALIVLGYYFGTFQNGKGK